MIGQLTIDFNTYFDGKTYDHELDQKRLAGQLREVFDLMKDGSWRSLEAIEREINKPQASISARLRDLRKSRFGGYTVNRRRNDSGLFEYQLLVASGNSSNSNHQ